LFKSLYLAPSRSRKILRFLFGASFWSTVIRPSAFLAFLSILAVLISFFLPANDTSEIQRLGAVNLTLFTVFGVIGNAIVGSWLGWGIAHWRFPTLPARVWPFWLWPAISGAFVYATMMIVSASMLGTLGTESLSSTDKVLSVVFALVFGPFFGILGAAFFRFIPHATALGAGREISDERGEI